jgi:hypothetical protein
MLFQTHLLTKLSEKRDEFISFDNNWRTDVIDYVRQLATLGGIGSIELRERLSGIRAPGALPSEELDELRSLAAPFSLAWKSHEEARRWALRVLTGHTTCAVDGSQYIPGRDISLPLAVVQIAVFENSHHAEGHYRKEAELFLITPDEIMRSGAEADSLIGFRRFEEEVRALRRFIERHKGWEERNEPMPSAFSTALSSSPIRNRVTLCRSALSKPLRTSFGSHVTAAFPSSVTSTIVMRVIS